MTPPPQSAGQSRWDPLKYVVLTFLILVWMAVVYMGLVARGGDWPIYVILACIGPLVLVTVISIARAAAWVVIRLSERR